MAVITKMDITQITQSGFKWNVRLPKGYQDYAVIHEVVAMDTYHLEEMASYFYPKVILDVGGHIGCFGVFAKSLWPEAELIVVEPNPHNMLLYKKNAQLNKMKKVKFYHGAISYNPACTCLVNAPSSTGGCLMRTRQEADGYINHNYRFYNRVLDDDVKLYTVEDIINDYDRIDLAKWDCEGGEVEAFKNMSYETAQKFHFMVGEYHLWSDKSEYLRPSLFECVQFWRRVRRKFSHLDWTYKEKPLGQFQAWPKEMSK